MELPDRSQAKSWEGLEVVDRESGALGSCVGVFADAETGVAEWLLVDVQGHRRSFVPALDAVEDGQVVRLQFARSQVVAAPSVGDAAQLSKNDEQVLYAHYGVSVSREDSGSLLPEDVSVAEAQVPTQAPTQPPTAASRRSAPETGGPSAAEAAAPLAALGGLAALVWLFLRARDRRAQRRRSLPVRSRELRRQLGTGSSKAVQEAGRSLSVLPGVAAQTGASVSRAAQNAGSTVSRQGSALVAQGQAVSREGRKAASRKGKALSQSGGKALAEGRKEASKRKKEAAKRKKALSRQGKKAWSRQGKKAWSRQGKGLSQRGAGVLSRQKDAVAGQAQAVSRRGADVVDTAAAVPRRVAKTGRKARRSVARTLWRATLATTAAAGYVLGARAGRERYREIVDLAGWAASQPQVEKATETVEEQSRKLGERLSGSSG